MNRGLLRATALTALMALATSAWLGGCELNNSPGGGTGVDGLTGIVVDGRGAPVAGARVRVYPASVTLETLGKVAAATKTTAATVAAPDSTFTGTDGRYRFEKLPAGTYNLEASIRSNDTAYAIFLSGIVFDKKLDLGVDTLQASGSMTLRVRGEGQTRLAGARCEIPGSPWVAISDSAGICFFAELPPGNYPVIVRHADLAPVSRRVIVRSRWRTEGGEAYLGPVGGFAPAGWRHVSIRGYDFYIPESLRLEWMRDGDDSLAYYSAAGMRLVVGTGMMETPDWIWRTETPEINPQPLVVDASARFPVYLVLRGGKVAVTLPAYGPSWSWLMRATVTIIEPAVDGIPTLEFTGWASSPQGLDTLAMALATIRKWNGPGEAPGYFPEAPLLRSPADGTQDTARSPTLIWRNQTGPSWVTHSRVQVSTDSLFRTFLVNDSVPVPTAAVSADPSRRVGPLEPGTVHFWRVVAIGPAGAAVSETRRYTTAATSPAQVSPNFPLPNSVGVAVVPLLEWGVYYSYAGIEGYRIQLSTDSSFASLALDTVVTQAEYMAFSPATYPGLQVTKPLMTNTLYYWRIFTLGRLGTSTVSRVNRFTTTREIIIDQM